MSHATRHDQTAPTAPSMDPLILEGVAVVSQLLATSAMGDGSHVEAEATWSEYEGHLRAAGSDSPLAALVGRLRLGSFEVKALLVLLSMHAEPLMRRLLAEVDPLGEAKGGAGVTVRTLLQHLCTDVGERVAARRVLLPGAALIDRHIVHLGATALPPGDGLLDRPLQMTAPAVRYCLSEPTLPAVRAGLYDLETPKDSLLDVVLDAREVGVLRSLTAPFAASLGAGPSVGARILLSGPPGTGKSLLSRALAAALGRPLLTLRAPELPDRAGLETALREALADAWLTGAVLVLDGCEAVLRPGDPRRDLVMRMLDATSSLALLHTSQPASLDPAVEQWVGHHHVIAAPDIEARQQIWEVHIPHDMAVSEDVDVQSLAERYDFAGATIRNAVSYAIAQARAAGGEARLTMALLEEACLAQVPRVDDGLTVRSGGHHRLRDIVLPDKALRQVTELVSACRSHGAVLSQWGFGARLSTGKGIISLFDGPPGTGKTFCAEIVANELGRPLHRVNIAEVVSKWAGETEKHIRKVFQQARLSHGVLLFDEADSLFSSRVTETRSASDRHSNMEVNLLLQEIERYPGVCILTTNSFGTLDKALSRRIQFRVTFEEPDAEQRERIWDVLCPPEAPRALDVDFAELADQFELTGARIKNALLRAAYRAHAAGRPLSMDLLEAACRDEYEDAGMLYVPRRSERPVRSAA